MKIKVIRSKRRTLSLSLGAEGEAVVRAPKRVSDAEIETFVARHRRWLEKRLAEREATRLSLDTGAVLPLFGKNYVIADGKPSIEGDTLYLPTENRAAALVALTRRLAKDILTQTTQRIASAYGFEYASVRISGARSRWGSCNRNGAIAYTFRLAFVPTELCEYVVVHELCHTRVFNHGAAFRKEVARVLPDWERRRKALRKQGALMNLFRENI